MSIEVKELNNSISVSSGTDNLEVNESNVIIKVQEGENTSIKVQEAGDGFTVNNVEEVVQVKLNEMHITNTNNSSTPNLQREIDFITDQELLVGYSPEGSLTSQPSWQIFKIIRSLSGPTNIFADSDESFEKIWDDRNTYTY